MLDITRIKDLFEELIKTHNIDKNDLCDNGAIYYMNGNDGTDFDYGCNNMTCEFFVFWKDSEAGAIKLNQRGEVLDFFIYPKEDPYGGEYIEEKFESPFDLHELCEYLQGEFDDKRIWNEPIVKWVLKDRSCISQGDEDEDEEEWW